MSPKVSKWKWARLASLPLVLALNACFSQSTPNSQISRANVSPSLPEMKIFQGHSLKETTKSNQDFIRDFMQLALEMENGKKLDVFTRFEGPITVRVTGDAPQTLTRDLQKLINRLRTEAQIDIHHVSAQSSANITIQAVPLKKIQSALPNAACFVTPNISDIKEYRKSRRNAKNSWSALRKREKLAIFLPNDVSPQEVRDCLHEELAQAIGPLNDLYRLSNSVFNDDNVHTILTGFDMLILRAYYSPRLQNGMTPEQVRRELPVIFNQINPAGNSKISQNLPETPQSWSQAIQTALGSGRTHAQRVSAAQQALNIAISNGWIDHRRAIAHYAMGRILQEHKADKAYAHFVSADRIFASRPNTRLHRAYVASHLAAYAISSGDGNHALMLLSPHLKAAHTHENAALLSTLMMLQAQALDLVKQHEKARKVRLDSLAWARYGFGPDWAVREKLQEIAALAPSTDMRGSL